MRVSSYARLAAKTEAPYFSCPDSGEFRADFGAKRLEPRRCSSIVEWIFCDEVTFCDFVPTSDRVVGSGLDHHF